MRILVGITLFLGVSAQAQELFSDSFEQRVIFDTQSVNGSVVLPAGISLGLDDVTVENAVAAGAPVAANGSFELPAGLSPQLSAVVDSAGNAVLLGWLAPGYTNITSRTTAEVLLYLRVGGTTTHPLLYRQIIDLMADETAALDAIEQALVAALAANPAALVEGNQALTQALDDAVTQIIADATPPQVKAVQVTPGEQSGIEVLTAFQAIQVRNRRLRPAVAYVDRTQCTVSGVPSPAGSGACPAYSQDFPVPAVTGVDTLPAQVQSIADVIPQLDLPLPGAYDPVTTLPQLLPVTEDSDSNDYSVRIVGPGLDPGIFDQLTAEQRNELLRVNAEYVVRHLVLPYVVNLILPTESTRLDQLLSQGENTLVRDITNLLLTVTSFQQAVTSGDYISSAEAGINSILRPGSVRDRAIPIILRALFVRADSLRLEAFIDRAHRVLDALSITGGMLANVDQTVLGYGFGTSNLADEWMVNVTPVPVSLTGNPSRASCAEPAVFRAQLSESPGTTEVRYRYVINANLGQLRDPNDLSNVSGREIVTASNKVEFLPLASNFSDSVEILVDVEAVADGRVVLLGSARATATIDPLTPRLTPRLTSLMPEATVELTAALQDGRNNVNCEGTVTPNFIWSSTDSAGTLDVAQGLVTNQATVTYEAGESQGTDTVTVEVFVNGDSVGTATAEVRVETQPSIVLGTFVLDIDPASDNPPTNRFCYNATIMVPDVGGSRYRMSAYGGFDPDFYGSRISDSGPPFDNGFGVTYTQEDRRFALSATCGPENPGSEAWLRSRFGEGWVWEITVDYP
ncbi:MAG: hypothetical protein AAGA23_05280 [Pseudomonadota bacterium]